MIPKYLLMALVAGVAAMPAPKGTAENSGALQARAVPVPPDSALPPRARALQTRSAPKSDTTFWDGDDDDERQNHRGRPSRGKALHALHARYDGDDRPRGDGPYDPSQSHDDDERSPRRGSFRGSRAKALHARAVGPSHDIPKPDPTLPVTSQGSGRFGKSLSDKSLGVKPLDDSPLGDKPLGDKPLGDKSFDRQSSGVKLGGPGRPFHKRADSHNDSGSKSRAPSGDKKADSGNKVGAPSGNKNADSGNKGKGPSRHEPHGYDSISDKIEYGPPTFYFKMPEGWHGQSPRHSPSQSPRRDDDHSPN
ncbi:uncharacterized protein PgNI_09644 [Pyricularia grisea]|uniref:Uncharacterized protein n=1 Tax=Pyricularia grisea TaxID=148305 RepID=A0A6P8AT59_PYRGI|nr:uncharacterized protein PgNI_09644 [Pyricularia grisea]TLD05319.1 hypothetical protein PgNI_09644 [Pyricularia grisea]